MRGYDRYEYEDLDEYEEDGEEEEEAGEEEYEEEEDPKPTKEMLDYLELRQRLKEEKRKMLKKELGTGSSREKNNAMPKPKDNYGSFFGPSQPVIAQRVIQESKSLLENPNLAARAMKSHQTANKNPGSASVGSKPQTNGVRPKATNVTKVQMLRNTRDYSFLLSDDVELPAPSRDPPTRNVFPPKSEARTAQLQERRKEVLNNNGRKVFNNREDKKPTPTVGRVQARVANERSVSMDKYNRTLVDSRKIPSSSNRTLADPRKQHSSSNGTGPGRPVVSKGVPSKISGGAAEKKVGAPAPRLPPTSGIQKSAPSKSNHPVSKPSLIRRGDSMESRKPSVLTKQMAPPPKPKVSQPPPRSSSRAMPVDDRSKKKPRRHDDDDDDVNDAISEIRKMFGYNPRRYADDDDDSDMEANFDDIMREEKRSAKIARREDEEELRKLEEEERRERLRKEAKKRKMMR